MSKARFPVVGQFKGGAPIPGTVIIERGVTALFAVRPLHMKRTYELTLNKVAEFVVWHVTKKELAEKRAAKMKKRAESRRARKLVRRPR